MPIGFSLRWPVRRRKILARIPIYLLTSTKPVFPVSCRVLRKLPSLRLSLTGKLFIVLLLLNAALVAAVAVGLQWTVARGFATYVSRVELGRLDKLAAGLVTRYEARGEWDFLPEGREQRRAWLRDELDRYLGDARPDGRHPPPPRRWPDEPGPPGDDPGGGPPLGGPPPMAGGEDRPPPPPRPDGLALRDRVALLDSAGTYMAGNEAATHSAAQRDLISKGVVIGRIAILTVVAADDALQASFLADQARSIWILGGVVFVLSALAAALLARHVRRPIAALVGGARQLAAGRYETRIAVDRSDELGALAQDFNHLALALARHEDARRQWVADTSHELRTPVAVLLAQVEALQDGIRKPDGPTLRAMHNQISGLGKLIDDLNELARSDVGQLQYRMEPLDLSTLLAGQVEAHTARFANADLTLSFVPASAPCMVNGDYGRLTQLFTNLLENSVRYTDGGGQLLIAMSFDDGDVCVRFDDTEPAVPGDALPKLFDRFYRVDASRNRASGGSGLGLALCASIVDAHGGQIIANNSPLGGLKIEVRIPRLK